MEILAATGHRPERLGGYSQIVSDKLLRLAIAALTRQKPDQVISGMALGWDTAIARAAITLEIPLIAAVPFADQDKLWTLEDRKEWEYLLFQTQKIVFCDRVPGYKVSGVEEGEYSPVKLFNRNKWMVDNCTNILALYNGNGKGGTHDCLTYAGEKGKDVLNVWSSWVKYS